MIVSRKIATIFKHPGFINIDYLVRCGIYISPSVILNALTREWRRWKRPAGFNQTRLRDPNFGYETKGALFTSVTGKDILMGSWFTCPETGNAESITFYGKVLHDYYSKCALYKKADNSKVQETEEIAGDGTDAWHTYNFIEPKPSLEDIDYWILWGFDFCASIYFDDETNKGGSQTITYPTFPDTFEPTSEDRKYSIYCTYTTPIVQRRLTVESTPITGIPVTIDGVEAGSTPVSTMVSEGDHTVAVPSEQERSKRR